MNSNSDNRALDSAPHGIARSSRLKLVLRRLLTSINRYVPKQRRRPVFYSIPCLEDGVRCLVEAALERGYEPVILIDSSVDRSSVKGVFGERVATAARTSLRGAWAYLRSEYVFCTHGLFDDPVPPRSQKVVNIWHGEPSGKLVSLYDGQRETCASLFPVQSELGRAFRCAEFGASPSTVQVLGAPRNDVLFRPFDRNVASQLGINPVTHQTYLWMPTFRAMKFGNYSRVDAAVRYPGVPYPESSVSYLDDWLCSNQVEIVVKLHPLDADKFEDGKYQNIRALRQEDLAALGVTTYGILPMFDGLITDISSIWVDYLLVNKPILFAFPDIADYRESRGINFEPYGEFVPGPLLERSVDQLIREMMTLRDGTDEYSTRRERARLVHHRFVDGQSTGRVLDFVGMKTSSYNKIAGSKLSER